METTANHILKANQVIKPRQPEAWFLRKPRLEVMNVPCRLRSHRPIFLASRNRSADTADGGQKACEVQTNWNGPDKKMQAALLFNRRLWTIFMARRKAMTSTAAEVRQNILNIAVFVMQRTIEMQSNPNRKSCSR